MASTLSEGTCAFPHNCAPLRSGHHATKCAARDEDHITNLHSRTLRGAGIQQCLPRGFMIDNALLPNPASGIGATLVHDPTQRLHPRITVFGTDICELASCQCMALPTLGSHVAHGFSVFTYSIWLSSGIMFFPTSISIYKPNTCLTDSGKKPVT